MSNVKSMEKLDKLERLLQQNLHGITITDCARKLGVHRTTVYKYLYTLDLQGKAYYERGIAYPGKRSTESEEKLSSKPSRLNLFEYRKWKRQYDDKRLDEAIRALQCDRDIYHEEFEIYKKLPFEKWNDPLPVDIEAKLRKKWRKYHGLE